MTTLQSPKVQIDDYIQIKNCRGTNSEFIGQIARITGIGTHGPSWGTPYRYYFQIISSSKHNKKMDWTDYEIDFEWFQGSNYGYERKETEEKSLKTNNIIKKAMNTIKNLFRKEPEASFIKAGLLDENEEITPQGRQALDYILWEANKEELKRIADKIIEKNKNC